MPVPERTGDLELGEDPVYQRREWLFERVGWVFMIVVIVAALLGLLGQGPLSNKSVGEPTGRLWLEYEGFVRYHDQATLRVHLSGSGKEASVWFDRAYWDALDIKSISPAPTRLEAGADKVQLTFLLTDTAKEPSGQQAMITVRFEPDALGVLSGRVGLPDGPPLEYRQFVYP